MDWVHSRAVGRLGSFLAGDDAPSVKRTTGRVITREKFTGADGFDYRVEVVRRGVVTFTRTCVVTPLSLLVHRVLRERGKGYAVEVYRTWRRGGPLPWRDAGMYLYYPDIPSPEAAANRARSIREQLSGVPRL